MINPKISQYIENVRDDLIEIYKCNQSDDKEVRKRIKFLALDTLMHLDKCLERQRRDDA